ncbi:hypothetical protein PMKS-000048 [Pichia membranifaciens]|uniref:Uncharacterized protein n=1 Tax=Pichia membranifaciens TaxID=4926 RepID=A0A1Q2YAM7_9ASCO|nr:hypothetical protein PMKS-000048 [Pichia membranifaciens]
MTGTENKPLNPQHGNNLNDMSSENGNTKSNNDKMALTKKYDQVADGRISKPNPLSSDNILSTQYHISDEENDDPMLANNWTEDDSNLLEEDSLITVAQKAVSITNAYMNSQEIQPMLNGEKIKRIKVKQEYLEGPINSQDESAKGHSRKEDGKEKENGEQDHEQDEEENNDSEDEQKVAFDHKKDDDSEDDDDDHGKSNGNYNGKLNVSGEDSSGKDNQNNESTNSDDANGSSQHRNTAIDSTQDLDTLKLLKFKTLLDMDQADNLIINEGTLINMPSNKITNRGLSWYTRFLSSTPDTFDEDLRDAEGRLFPTIANEGLASLESQNKTQNIDSLSPACFLSHITNGELQRKSQTPTEQNPDNYNEADYEYLLNSAEPESKALVTGRRRRVQKKHPSNSHHPASKKKNMKKISKEMGAKLLLDAISKSRKTYDRCKLYQDGRRKLQSSKKHVNLSELPFYITQFMKQP